MITRLSDDPTPAPDGLYGPDLGGLRFDAVPVRCDHTRWLAEFLDTWPPGTPAHRSYYSRITDGTWLTIAGAARGSVTAVR